MARTCTQGAALRVHGCTQGAMALALGAVLTFGAALMLGAAARGTGGSTEEGGLAPLSRKDPLFPAEVVVVVVVVVSAGLSSVILDDSYALTFMGFVAILRWWQLSCLRRFALRGIVALLRRWQHYGVISPCYLVTARVCAAASRILIPARRPWMPVRTAICFGRAGLPVRTATCVGRAGFGSSGAPWRNRRVCAAVPRVLAPARRPGDCLRSAHLPRRMPLRSRPSAKRPILDRSLLVLSVRCSTPFGTRCTRSRLPQFPEFLLQRGDP